MKKQQYNSWEIVGDKVAIKHCDKSFYDHHGSGLPIGMREYFDSANLPQGGKRDIRLRFQDTEYKAYITRETTDTKRTRIFWYKDLSHKFNEIYQQYKVYSQLKFEKRGSDLYEIEFVDVNSIEEEDNYELESCVEDECNEKGNKEGKVKLTYGTKYERDPKNRRNAIKIHGAICAVCEFDFGKTYGELGKGFIEVHHIKPLSEMKTEVVVNPKTDLVCLCSNCHRMIHRRRDEILTIEQLKDIIKNNR